MRCNVVSDVVCLRTRYPSSTCWTHLWWWEIWPQLGLQSGTAASERKEELKRVRRQSLSMYHSLPLTLTKSEKERERERKRESEKENRESMVCMTKWNAERKYKMNSCKLTSRGKNKALIKQEAPSSELNKHCGSCSYLSSFKVPGRMQASKTSQVPQRQPRTVSLTVLVRNQCLCSVFFSSSLARLSLSARVRTEVFYSYLFSFFIY